MNTTILRFLVAGLLSLPALLAVADDRPAATPAPAAQAPDESTLRQQLDDANNKLATALRSYSLLEEENTQLKAQQTANGAEIEKLRQAKSELEGRLAAPPAATGNDQTAQLAEANDKLNTALRSYSLLQAENDQLKEAAAKSAAAAQATAGKSAAEAAAQIAALSEQLRQTQATAAALATENAQLKTRLAIVGPPPAAEHAAPVRPGTAAAAAVTTPLPAVRPVATPPSDMDTPAADAGPRQHVVVEGDTLAKLARRYYGNTNRWNEILEANRDVIKNENVLPVGATLRIP